MARHIVAAIVARSMPTTAKAGDNFFDGAVRFMKNAEAKTGRFARATLQESPTHSGHSKMAETCFLTPFACLRVWRSRQWLMSSFAIWPIILNRVITLPVHRPCSR
jgi:hypothetical protein